MLYLEDNSVQAKTWVVLAESRVLVIPSISFWFVIFSVYLLENSFFFKSEFQKSELFSDVW